jgi:hypothetical protein
MPVKVVWNSDPMKPIIYCHLNDCAMQLRNSQEAMEIQLSPTTQRSKQQNLTRLSWSTKLTPFPMLVKLVGLVYNNSTFATHSNRPRLIKDMVLDEEDMSFSPKSHPSNKPGR